MPVAGFSCRAALCLVGVRHDYQGVYAEVEPGIEDHADHLSMVTDAGPE